jgi:hypothetical protein
MNEPRMALFHIRKAMEDNLKSPAYMRNTDKPEWDRDRSVCSS